MKNRLLLGTLAVLLGACSKAPDIHSPESEYYRQQEAQVLVDLFEEIIAPGEYIPLPPPPPGTTSKLPYDTVYYDLYVADRLIPLKEHWNYRHLRNKSDRADSAEQLLAKLTDSITTSVPIPLEVVTLTKHHNFYVGSSVKPVVRGENSKPKAHLLFSRISFNRTFTAACFLQDYGCGSECGGGTLIFAKKMSGRWRITKRWHLWVS
ncbi:hypothetical protein [Hymenobacter metallicola]|uniref:Lipoprotein n=1 Tax=Hymenobacter metallicola TaxID=2563114 RepID=A0A4Z0Q0G6_9BACT|nr:hypothetical protein [Hymenobacter metallicola]TGE23059.1 hypothetical protein E5K02_22155 [Hymenobacter metallicola]